METNFGVIPELNAHHANVLSYAERCALPAAKRVSTKSTVANAGLLPAPRKNALWAINLNTELNQEKEGFAIFAMCLRDS